MRAAPVILVALVGAAACEPAAGARLGDDDPAPPASLAPALEPASGVEPVQGRPVVAGPWMLSTRFLTFPTVRPDCGPRLRALWLKNAGEGPGRVSVGAVNGPFALNAATPSELELPAGGSMRLEVFLPPAGPGRHFGQLALGLEGAGEVVVRLAAEVVPGHRVEDRVVTSPITPMAWLFVIDEALLMGGAEPTLRANLQSILRYLQAQHPEPRWAMISSRDDGKSGAGLLLGSDGGDSPWFGPGDEARFFRRLAEVQFGAGEKHQLLRNAVEVLGSGLLPRPGADVKVVLISTGEDRSPGSVDVWIDALEKIGRRPDVRSLSVAGVAGGPRGCAGGAPSDRSSLGLWVEPSPRILAVAEATGGPTPSLCQPRWTRPLEVWDPAPDPRFQIYLSGAPRPASLEVAVDGRLLPRDAELRHWSFVPEANRVDFALFAHPPPGAEVDVRYVTSCR